jgi:hypothetical protein
MPELQSCKSWVYPTLSPSLAHSPSFLSLLFRVAQAGLALAVLPQPPSQVLGLQMCAITPDPLGYSGSFLFFLLACIHY